jgi:hypothetical protein
MTTPGSGRSSIGVRVRPNADNFIRDLKASMAAKRFTYWVDVAANMSQANKDVKAWAAGDLKTYDPKIPIGANMVQATQDLTKWKNLQRENKTNIPIGVDMTAAQRELTSWRQAAKRELEIPVKLNVRDLDAALERAANRKVKANVEVDGDTTPLERKVSGLFLPGGKFKTIKVDADTGEAERKIEGLKNKVKADQPKTELELDVENAENKLRRLRIEEAARKLSINLDVDADPKKAELQLRLLRARVAAQKLDLDVRVGKSATDRIQGFFKGVEKKFGSLTVLRSLDLGPITLGKPTGLIGTMATITTLAGLIPTAVTAVSALSDGLIRLAGAAAIVPGAIGAIGTSLAALLLSTGNISDTISAMFDVWNEGASKQAQGSKTALRAQDQYRNAIQDESKAQKDLSQARQDALNDLRNLNNELRGSVLNEAQAILDAQKARDRYAEGLAKGFDSETDRMQGLLDIAKADQNISDVRERNIGLQQKVNKGNQEGVEGSDKVTAALDAQTRATQAVAVAADAMVGQQSTTALGKYNDLLRQLSPNAQQFMNTLMGMRGPIQDFRNSLQDTLFQGLGPALEGMFKNLLPVIEPGMQAITAGLNKNILQVFDSLQSPDGKSIIERILGGTADTQQSLSKLIDPLVRGVGTLVAAGTEHLPQVVDLVGQLLDRFANFIEKADQNGTLDTFMNNGIQAMKDLAETGINMLKIINDLSTAFRGAFGQDIFGMLSNITEKWHEFLSSAEGQKKINGYLQEAKDLWNDWKPFLKDLPGLFEAVSGAAKAVLDTVMPFLTAFANFAKEHPGIVKAFIGTWLGAKILVGTLNPVLTVLQGILNTAKLIPGVTDALRRIPGIGPTLAGPAAPGPGAAPAGRVAGAVANTLGRASTLASVGLGVGAVTGALIDTGTAAAEAQPGQSDIDAMNAKLPPNTKPISGFHRDMATANAMKQLADQGDPAAKWIMSAAGPNALSAPGTLGADWMTLDPAAERELTKRYVWAMTHADATGPNFLPPPSYQSGGYTQWPQGMGQPVLLHGKEYIEPADTVAHYGVGAMEAIHNKRVPKGLLQSYQTGGQVGPNPWDVYGPPHGPGEAGGQFNPNMQIDLSHIGVAPPPPFPFGRWAGALMRGTRTPGGHAPGESPLPGFYSGGYYDPTTGQWVPEQPTDTNAAQPNPAGGPGIIPSVVQGAADAAPMLIQNPQGIMAPAPGPVDAAGNPTYPADSSTDNTYGVDTSGGTYTPKPGDGPSINLFGINIPLNQKADPTRGWGPDGPPKGLGGGPPGPKGEAPFDMRKFGIGPGPPGSGPSDWMNFAGKTAGNFISGLGSSLLTGALGFFGLEGITSTPLFQAATGLTEHFFNAPGFAPQAPGNADTNAAVGEHLQTWANMPQNPDYPGYAQMPQVYDANGNLIPQQLPPGTGPGITGPIPVDTQHPDATKVKYLADLARQAGLRVGSGSGVSAEVNAIAGAAPHDNDGKLHSYNEALDIGNGPDDVGFAKWWISDPARVAATKELILHVPGWDDGMNIKNGKFVKDYGGGVYDPGTLGGHTDHMHLAIGSIPNTITDTSGLNPVGYDPAAYSPAPDPAADPSVSPAPPGHTSWWGPNKGIPRGYHPTPRKTGSSGPAGIAPLYAGTPGTNPLLTGFPGAVMPAGGPGVEKWRPVFAHVLQRLGLPQEPWLTLGMKQLATESQGNQYNINRSDSNAAKGTPSKGLMQLIDPTFQASLPAGFDRNIFNPESNIAAAIVYTLGKYGGPNGVWGEGHGYDSGGWLMPGRTIADNATGKPELVIPHDQLASFAVGGQFLQSLPIPPKPPPPLPRGPQAIPKVSAPPPPPPPRAVPQPTPPPITPMAPPPPPTPHGGTGAPPGPAPTGRDTNAVAYGPAQPPAAPTPDGEDHVHPALRKGIASTAAVAGNLASAAASMGMGGLGGGGAGQFISGLFQQGGKIAENIANVGASFLVGNITGGTTANAYGVTQRGVNPTGGTKMIDASNNQYGDIYTNNLDDYFSRVERRDAQKAQVGLGAWGR